MFIYILKLENNKYYVGKTLTPFKRITQHFKEIGSEWTKLHKPLEIEEIIPNCDDYDEDKYTRIYMDKYGINNVRGGSFVQVKLSEEDIKILNKMKNGTNDNCFKCGNSDHFVKDCKKVDNIKVENNNNNNNNNNIKVVIVKVENTKVVNVKVDNIRPKHNNLKEWCTDTNNIYISNKGIVFITDKDGKKEKYPKMDSKWANNFHIPKDSTDAFRNLQLQKYKEYILEKIKENPVEYNIEELRGKNLGCWCHPEKCHGDILVEILNSF
jgi:hypothetical protein